MQIVALNILMYMFVDTIQDDKQTSLQ